MKPVHFKGEFRRYSARITARFAFRDDAVAGRHVWMDKHLKSRVFVFISDEVRAAMMAAGLTGVATRPVDPRLTPHGSPVLKGPPESHRRHAALASAKRNGYTAPANARIAPFVRKAAPGARATEPRRSSKDATQARVRK